MAITADEDRARIGDLALSAFRSVEDYGDDAELLDAILVYEVSVPDDDDERGTEGSWHATSYRASVNVGMLTMALTCRSEIGPPGEEEP